MPGHDGVVLVLQLDFAIALRDQLTKGSTRPGRINCATLTPISIAMAPRQGEGIGPPSSRRPHDRRWLIPALASKRHE
jgi:hypothetical protein